MKLTRGSVVIVALLLAAGCRSQQFDASKTDGGVEPGIYSFFGLPTGLQRVAVAKYDASRRLCSVMVLVFGPTSSSSVEVPKGWAFEAAQLEADVDACSTDYPMLPPYWPATASGTIEFPSGTPQFPCSVSVDATLAALASTSDGKQRPANIPATDHLRADDVTVEGNCAP